MKKAWYSKKWVIVLLHAATWILVFSMPYLLQSPQQNESQDTSAEEHSFYLALITNISWVIFFYFNAYFLIPKLVYKKRYWTYSLVILLIFSWLVLQTSLLFRFFYNLPGIEPLMHLRFILFVFLLMLASSLAYRMIMDRMKEERRAKEKENENLKTELAFLRSQVSPHFMFNVLNNMVALARKKSEELEPSLIQLSSLLRYMLYETNEEKVPLEKEIEYLKSYISLQSQRFSNKVNINVLIAEPDANYYIEPMLLIPFVENAFKHGVALVEHAEINVELTAKNNVLNFRVRNQYNALEIKDKTPGIGLQNVQRRLNLLYANNHSLVIDDKNNYFTVLLTINLL